MLRITERSVVSSLYVHRSSLTWYRNTWHAQVYPEAHLETGLPTRYRRDTRLCIFERRENLRPTRVFIGLIVEWKYYSQTFIRSFESVVWKIDRLMDQFRNWKCGSSSNCEIGIIFHLYCYPLIDNYILRIDSHQSDRKDKLPTYIFRTILKYQIIRWYYPRGNWKFSFQSFLDLNRSIGIVRKGSVRRNPDGWLVSSVGLIVGPR